MKRLWYGERAEYPILAVHIVVRLVAAFLGTLDRAGALGGTAEPVGKVSAVKNMAAVGEL